MATNQNFSPPDKTGKASGVPVPSLDESLAQLEEALDLFASSHGDGQFGETHVLNEAPSLSPIVPLPKMQSAEPAPAAALPIKDESFEQAIKELKQKIATPSPDGIAPLPVTEVVIRTPEDDEGPTRRRFPLFTDSQKKLMLLTVIVLAFFALIGYLIWQRQKSDEMRLALEKQENIQFRSLPTARTTAAPTVSETSSAALPSADQGLTENVKQILVAYNPTAATTRYKIEVKDGVVTLNGDVQSQLEKDGVENVIKPLTGITKIVNNLVIKGVLAGPAGAAPSNGPVMFPQVNPAEAKRLEESLKRDLAEGAKRAEEERLRIEQQNSQLAAQRNNPDEAAKQEAARQEAERLRRQQTAAMHNEEDVAFRKQAEERLRQRDKEEAERRVEEQRKAEASPKAEPPRTEPSNLRSGTVTWRGLVKGVDDVVIRGSSASLQHVAGDQSKDAKGVFSTAMPTAPISVRLVAAIGPAPIRIIQQPSVGNNFTTIVRVGEGGKGEGKPHTFTLRWATQ